MTDEEKGAREMVRRYRPDAERFLAGMSESDTGDYVKYRDYRTALDCADDRPVEEAAKDLMIAKLLAAGNIIIAERDAALARAEKTEAYATHKRSCDMMSAFTEGKSCTCGFDAPVPPKPSWQEAAQMLLGNTHPARDIAFSAMWDVAEKHSLEATNSGGARYSITGDIVNELYYSALCALARGGRT